MGHMIYGISGNSIKNNISDDIIHGHQRLVIGNNILYTGTNNSFFVVTIGN